MTDHDPGDPIDAIDAKLVAWLHGELDPEERRAVRERLRTDPDARARLAALEAADRALGEALEREQAPRPAAGVRTIVQPLLALAALLAVVAVFVWPDEDEPATAGRNDHLELRAAPRGGAAVPLFTDAALELFWRNLHGGDPRRPIRVVPFPFGRTRAELGAELDRSTLARSYRTAVLPVILWAEITDPEGIVRAARFAPRDAAPFEVADARAVQTVRLRDFEVMDGRPRPVLVGQPGDGEWLADARWPFTHMPHGETARWFPEIPGEYRIELRVEALPAPERDPWPTFDEPVAVSTAIVMSGRMTGWGEAHDGLSARLVWSTGARTADATPFALQIRNDATEPKKYNYGGSTIAKIPQPLHYTLIVDGEEWQQHDRVPLFLPASAGFWPQPVGTVRTFVARADYWQNDGTSLGGLPGNHRVGVKFHFQPSLWNPADTSIWHGELSTPELEVEVQKAR